jgi:hypothetical protein
MRRFFFAPARNFRKDRVFAQKREMPRPSFRPTAAQRRQVAIAAGGGMSHEAIALALGLSRNTLRKHFAEELTSGAVARRMEVLRAQYRAAVKGNVAAQKAYLLHEPQDPTGAGAPAKPRAAPAVGKKEQAQAAARQAAAGTDWDDLLPRPGTRLQ